MRRVSIALFVAALVAALVGGVTAGVVSTSPGRAAAATVGGTTSYSLNTTLNPVNVDGVENGPWTTSQGDPSQGAAYPESDLFPTYTPGGSTTTLGGTTEPNVAVYPAASGATPYPSGVAGTPGPLDDYCSSGGANPETGTLTTEPANTDLPMSPYYFPHVVRNADGSLTGYFDYRPKDADEAIVVAKSTDNGQTWNVEGEALEENQDYCPTADVADDGQGHPFTMSVDGHDYLYTLQRPAGDNVGVGLLVHSIDPSASNPLAGLPSTESVGVDPNTFATGATTVPTSGGVDIPVSSLGTSGSPYQIVAGPYEDMSLSDPSAQLITCTGVTSTGGDQLTGCTAEGSSASVGAGDDLVQVIATVNPSGSSGCTASPCTIPQGPNTPAGTGGLANLPFTNATSVSPLTTYLINDNAPNRLYIDGWPVYCVQANANPTTKVEDCTTTKPGGLSVQKGDPITADPIDPPTAQMTTGLDAPDGIVGVLPGYSGNGVPTGATTVLYTEKILNYFIEGTVNGYVSSGTYSAKSIALGSNVTINYTPSVTTSEQSLQNILSATGTITINLGTTASSPIQTVTCTGLTSTVPSGAPAGSMDLTGCSGGSGSVSTGNWVGGPNACTVGYSALSQIGEGNDGASKGPEKLFANNEDLTVLRMAYTTDGIDFTDVGPISGSSSATGNESGSYTDISNPNDTESPTSADETAAASATPSSPESIPSGTSDSDELRFVGSGGTIIQNPDGSYGMFLSGSWCSDGDSDAFNQIFYSSSTDGLNWSTPKVVLGTDYTFSASAAQDAALANGEDEPLGVSAYYSGRVYGPSVVQNPDGSLTMVFSGYRLPKPITSAGTPLGTNASDQYTVGATDPALYRNILTVTLSSSTTPAVATTTSLSSSDGGENTVGDAVTYTATVSVNSPGTGTPTGTVSFTDPGGTIPGCGSVALSETSPDTASCTTTYGAPGSDEVTASYSGDPNYATSSSSLGEAITETTTTTLASSDAGSAVAGETVTYTATVAGTAAGAGTPTGTVSFTDPGGTIAGCGMVELSESSPDTASCTTTYTGPGSDDVTATYSGDTDYQPSASTPFGESISQASTSVELESSPAAVVVGQSVTYTATVGVTAPGAGAPTGTVSFTDPGGTIAGCGMVELSESSPDTASCTTAYESVGTGADDVTATYSGDSDYTSSASEALSEPITKDSTTVTLTADPPLAVTGEPVTLDASVLVDAPGSGTPTGTVEFEQDGTAIAGCGAVGLDGSGDATCTTSYSSNSGTPHSIVAVYSGDGNDLAGSSNALSEPVAIATSVTASASPPLIEFGQAVVLRAAGLPKAATGTVDFSSGADLLCQATVSKGVASCSPSVLLGAGTYSIEAAYSGDSTYASSTATASLGVVQVATAITAKVSPAHPKYGVPVTITAEDIPKLATGTVTFTTGSRTLCSLPAARSVACSVPRGLPAGSYTVVVDYSGDADYASSSADVSLLVAQARVPFRASASPSSVASSSEVTLSAIGLPADASGSVVFSSGGATLCSVAVTASTVSCSPSPGLTKGTYAVVATYSGDPDYLSSTARTSFKVTG